MSKYRQAARIDSNQNEIVDALRSIHGVTVQPGMDDILVGYKGNNFWFEIKTPDCVSKKTGEVRESAIKASQKELRKNWRGNYHIVFKLEQILEAIGVSKK